MLAYALLGPVVVLRKFACRLEAADEVWSSERHLRQPLQAQPCSTTAQDKLTSMNHGVFRGLACVNECRILGGLIGFAMTHFRRCFHRRTMCVCGGGGVFVCLWACGGLLTL